MKKNHALVISDLHLSRHTPFLNKLFFDFLDHKAKEAQQLYILGDLFELWVGDDCADPVQQKIISRFHKLSQEGTCLFFLPGNRDFLVGKDFLRETGAKLLEDEAVVDLYGKRILFMHGDTLCTLDKKYQLYRRVVSKSFLQKAFLALPKAWRLRVAEKIRAKRGGHVRHSPECETIFNATACAVSEAFLRHKVNYMIHGHTHQLGIHFHPEKKIRFVLGDWQKNALSYLKISSAGAVLMSASPRD